MSHRWAPYGFCPRCGATGRSRERRPNGNDRCALGHIYPSATAIDENRPAATALSDWIDVIAGNTGAP